MNDYNREKKKKKKRIDIGNFRDLKRELKNEGYEIDNLKEENLKNFLIETFLVSDELSNKLFELIENYDITYRADNVKGFIEYIEKIIIFEGYYEKLINRIKNIEVFEILREEYEREVYEREEIGHILDAIDIVKNMAKKNITDNEVNKLKLLEEEIEKENLFTKDIELLKKIIISEGNFLEEYNKEKQIKTLLINVADDFDLSYIKHKRGTVEYHEYLRDNIPRIHRLIKNINKYIIEDKRLGRHRINQSNTLQDSINIAMVTYDNKVFKAISGKQDIKSYCKTLRNGEAVFKSARVNKLGELGTGYNRINDSEKKILEEINRQIELGLIKDNGKLILCSKWEPCPSCYYVISQFLEKYPNIDMEIKYSRAYGS